MKIPIGFEIQGATILSDECYRNENSDLIIPDGKYLGDIFNQMPYGRIDKKVTGIGATTLELESKRNSIIVVPSQYLAYSKSITSKEYLDVGGEISGKIKPTSVDDVRKYIANSSIQYKKLICVAESLKKALEVITGKLDDWFIMLDEIDTFQEQSNFREGLEKAIDYYLLFNTENRCLVSATLKDFSNNQLHGELLLTINVENPKQRTISVIYYKSIDDILIHELLKKKEQILKKNEKIVIAYNAVKDSVKLIDFLPDKLKKECKLLCSKSRESDVKVHFGELNEGILPARINFMTSAYFAGIDIHDSFHLIYVSNIKKPHTLHSIDKIHQIHGRARIKKNADGEDIYSILSETLIHNSDGTIKNELEQSKDDLLELAEKQKKLAACVEVFYKDRKDRNFKLAEIRKFQNTMLNDKNYKNTSYIRFKEDLSIEISYFNIDSALENQVIRNEMYATPESVEEHLKSVNFNVLSFAPPSEPNSIPELHIEKDKKKSVYSIRDQALDNILDNGNIDYLLNNSNGEENEFYRMYDNLSQFIDTDFLNEELKRIQRKSLHPTALKNFEKAVQYESYEKDFPFKSMMFNQFKIGNVINKDKIPEIMNSIYNDPKVGIPIKFKTQTAIPELKIYFEIKETKSIWGRKITIIKHNPRNIKINERFGLIFKDKIYRENREFEPVYLKK